MDTKLTLVRPEPTYPDAKRPTTFVEGVEFQDFVCKELAKRHVILQNMSSQKYQFTIGENLQGFEIKLDNRCTETERLSIEVAEKSAAGNAEFVPSGIFRRDNSWLYIHGNYQMFFVFARNILQLLARSNRYQFHELPTIRKFYIPIKDARKYAALTVDFSELPFC